jgi:PBP1b-binding outer membrane lipoprotein LpoB
MKKGHFLFSALFISICLLVACTKTKDDKSVDPPVNNNPPVSHPQDSTPPPPTFTDFSPATAFIGDTITITGTNLGTNITALHVRFGSVDATVVSAANTVVKVIVPNDIEEATNKIQLTINNSTVSPEKSFLLKAPVIESISYTKGFPGQTIKIQGKGFRNSYKFNQVTFGTKAIDKGTVNPGNTTLTIHAPDRFQPGKYAISVTIAGMTATATDSFTVITPSIQSISPTSGDGFSVVTITGDNLKDDNGGSTAVFFSDWQTGLNTRAVYLQSVSNNQIKAILSNLPAGTYRVSVMVVSGSIDFTQPFTCN